MENDNQELEPKIEEGQENEGGEEIEKPKLTPEQIKGIKQRDFTRLAKELGVELPKPKSEEVNSQIEKKDSFNYGEMAFLEAKGVKEEYYPIALEYMKSTGKTLHFVVNNKVFQAEIKEADEARESKEAIPSGSKRSVSATRDTKEYWIAKGELPPNTPDNRKLRQEVVNARMAKEKDVSMFAD